MIFLNGTYANLNRTFTIEGNDFVKDGKPFQIISGSMHYWRVRSNDWSNRLKLARSMGLNTITTYFNWQIHEKESGQFNFTGELDIVKWIQEASDAGLLVIARIGPYITAEVDFGGFPWWLTNEKNIVLRTTNPKYLSLVDRYLDQLIPLLAPFQYSLGGPIIDFQIEDDTDSDISIEETKAYYIYLRDALRKRGITTLINTLAFPTPEEVETAVIDGTWLALEFTYNVPTNLAFSILRFFYPTGPIMVMEFYPSWFDCEGEPHNILSADIFAAAVDNILKQNVSLSIYPIFGGTNFGFSNGAQHPAYIPWTEYCPVTTSYDFDAPINEPGDPTEKFMALREVIGRYAPLPPNPIPSPSKKGSYGTIVMKHFSPLFDSLKLFSTLNSSNPVEMESLGYGYGYVLYSTTLKGFTSSGTLKLIAMQDRATVYLDGNFQGVLGWDAGLELELNYNGNSSPQLKILVENKGRPSGEVTNFKWARKGILDNVLVKGNLVTGWTQYLLPMNFSSDQFDWKPAGSNQQIPAFYKGELTVTDSPPLDTFLLSNGWDMLDNWGHGFVMINGFNLGRFTELGPQRTLYVPRQILQTGLNEVFLFESDSPINTPSTGYRTMESIGEPLWN